MILFNTWPTVDNLDVWIAGPVTGGPDPATEEVNQVITFLISAPVLFYYSFRGSREFI